MSIIGWIVIGFLAGTVASWLTKSDAGGCIVRTVVGIVGALLGGFLFSLAGGDGVTDFSLWSLFVAIIGATLLLAIFGRR